MPTSASTLDNISAVMRPKKFFPPAHPQEIDDVGRELGVQFPSWLRHIYLATDGFLGPTGVRYLYRLGGSDGVLNFNRFLRQEWNEATWLSKAIIFAENGVGGTLTVHWAALDGQLIEWCYGDGSEYQVLDCDIFTVWAREQKNWDGLEAEG
jgi:hypothetical protein